MIIKFVIIQDGSNLLNFKLSHNIIRPACRTFIVFQHFDLLYHSILIFFSSPAFGYFLHVCGNGHPPICGKSYKLCVLGVKVSVVLTMQATIYGGLKQVVVLPWRSRKAKKDGLLSWLTSSFAYRELTFASLLMNYL